MRGNQALNDIDNKGTEPGYNALPDNHSNCPLYAEFSFYRGNGGDAG